MTQTNIAKQRRNEIKKAVIVALEKMHPPYLPLKIKEIVRSFSNIRLIPYSKHIRKMNISYQQMLEFTETKDACTDYYVDSDMYYIYYNDIDFNIVNSNRYRWNIAHELGHILLGHHKTNNKTRIFRCTLSSNEYDQLEEEADYFASLILVPHSALLGLKINNDRDLRLICKISNPAARKRNYEFEIWKHHINPHDEYDNRIFHYYYNFVFKRKCKYCSAGIIQRYGKYCPVCGSKNTLQWGDGMKYELLNSHAEGKLKECPRCKNEETELEGKYCQICGQLLRNECTNGLCECTSALPTNARYCPICGEQSSFFMDGILKSFDYVENNSSTATFNFFDDLPFN